MADPPHSAPPGGGQPDHGSRSGNLGQRKSRAGPGSTAGQGAGDPGGDQPPQQDNRQPGSAHGSRSGNLGQRKSKTGPGSAADQGAGDPRGNQPPQQVTWQSGSGTGNGSGKASTIPLSEKPTIHFISGSNTHRTDASPLNHKQWRHLFKEKKLLDTLLLTFGAQYTENDGSITFTTRNQEGDLHQWANNILAELKALSSMICSFELVVDSECWREFNQLWNEEPFSKTNLVTCFCEERSSKCRFKIYSDNASVLQKAQERGNAILDGLQGKPIEIPLSYFDDHCFQHFVPPDKYPGIRVLYKGEDGKHMVKLHGPPSVRDRAFREISSLVATLRMEQVDWPEIRVWISRAENQDHLREHLAQHKPGVQIVNDGDSLFLMGSKDDVVKAQLLLSGLLCTKAYPLSEEILRPLMESVKAEDQGEETYFIPKYYLLASHNPSTEQLTLAGPLGYHAKLLQKNIKTCLKNQAPEVLAALQKSAKGVVSITTRADNLEIEGPVARVQEAYQQITVAAQEAKLPHAKEISQDRLVTLLLKDAVRKVVDEHLSLPGKNLADVTWSVDETTRHLKIECKDGEKREKAEREIKNFFAERETIMRDLDAAAAYRLQESWPELVEELHEFNDCCIAFFAADKKWVLLATLSDRLDHTSQRLADLMLFYQKDRETQTLPISTAQLKYLKKACGKEVTAVKDTIQRKGGSFRIQSAGDDIWQVEVTGSPTLVSSAVRRLRQMRDDLHVVDVADAAISCLTSKEGKKFVSSLEAKYKCYVHLPEAAMDSHGETSDYAEVVLAAGATVSLQLGPLKTEGMDLVSLPVPVDLESKMTPTKPPEEYSKILPDLRTHIPRLCEKVRKGKEKVLLVTPPKKLSCRKVVLMAVPSKWDDGKKGEKKFVRSAVTELMETTMGEKCSSVAFEIPRHLPVNAAETPVLVGLREFFEKETEEAAPPTGIRTVKLFTSRQTGSRDLYQLLENAFAGLSNSAQRKIVVAAADKRKAEEAAEELSKFAATEREKSESFVDGEDHRGQSGARGQGKTKAQGTAGTKDAGGPWSGHSSQQRAGQSAMEEGNSLSTGINKLPEEMLNRLQRCEKCQENFQSPQRLPRILPCHHAFCEQCLQQLTNSKSLRCPMCQRSINAEGEFPVEIMRMTILDLTKVMGSQEGPECQGCSKGTKASSKCLQCDDLLCEDCCQAHKTVKISRDHSLVSLAEAASNPSKLLLLTEKCSEHKEESLKFYCPGCKEASCSSCIVARHNGHKMDKLEAVLEEKRKELKAVCGRMETAMPKFQNRVDLSAANLSALDDQKSRISDKIRTLFSEARKFLDNREKQILADFAAKVKQDRLGLEEQQAKDESLLSEAQASLQFGQDVTSLGLPSQLLSGPQDLTRTCDDLESQSVDPAVLVPEYQVDNSNLTRLADVVKTMGNISTKSSGGKTQWKKHGNQTRLEEHVPRGASAAVEGAAAEKTPEEATGGDNRIILPGGLVVIPYKADITKLRVTAIVNAANECLAHDGGVARTIADAAGPELNRECRDQIDLNGPVPVSGVCVTGPGRLLCTRVIHAVGPRWDDRTPELCRQQLYDTVLNCCRETEKWDLEEIAMPPISSGIFGMPKDQCTEMYCKALLDFDDQQPNKKLKTVHFVDINDDMPLALLKALRKAIGQGQQRTRPPETDVDTSQGCVICTENKFDQLVKLNDCNHVFCKACIEQWFQTKPTCPNCNKHYGIITGTMPWGTMNRFFEKYTHLAGFENFGCIKIIYNIPDGVQEDEHPNPGQRFKGARRIAYLPDNAEGNKVLGLLREAWDRKLTFTIGRSTTTGQENVVTWNDIHHKTSPVPGHPFGYPDPDYLSRVQEELAARGVTEESIKLSKSGNAQDFSQFYTPLVPPRPSQK